MAGNEEKIKEKVQKILKNLRKKSKQNRKSGNEEKQIY